MRLMLVEDEEMLGRFTAQSLIKSGFAVDWVKNGADAQASVRVHNYDMILLDLGLPGMSGEKVSRSSASTCSTSAPTTTWSSPWTWPSCAPASAH